MNWIIRIFEYFKYVWNLDRETFVNNEFIDYLNSLNEKDRHGFLVKLYDISNKDNE